jgi:hypothetical protein
MIPVMVVTVKLQLASAVSSPTFIISAVTPIPPEIFPISISAPATPKGSPIDEDSRVFIGLFIAAQQDVINAMLSPIATK